jgi:hypothetical protein
MFVILYPVWLPGGAREEWSAAGQTSCEFRGPALSS